MGISLRRKTRDWKPGQKAPFFWVTERNGYSLPVFKKGAGTRFGLGLKRGGIDPGLKGIGVGVIFPPFLISPRVRVKTQVYRFGPRKTGKRGAKPWAFWEPRVVPGGFGSRRGPF